MGRRETGDGRRETGDGRREAGGGNRKSGAALPPCEGGNAERFFLHSLFGITHCRPHRNTPGSPGTGVSVLRVSMSKLRDLPSSGTACNVPLSV